MAILLLVLKITRLYVCVGHFLETIRFKSLMLLLQIHITHKYSYSTSLCGHPRMNCVEITWSKHRKTKPVSHYARTKCSCDGYVFARGLNNNTKPPVLWWGFLKHYKQRKNKLLWCCRASRFMMSKPNLTTIKFSCILYVIQLNDHQTTLPVPCWLARYCRRLKIGTSTSTIIGFSQRTS